MVELEADHDYCFVSVIGRGCEKHFNADHIFPGCRSADRSTGVNSQSVRTFL
jgi:hypothetical protein